MARKFITLARASGIRLERSDVMVENLIPAELQAVSAEEFLSGADAFDGVWKDRMDAALARQMTLRYVGKLAEGKIRIGVEAVPLNSPLASLKGTDNLIAFMTRRYNASPMIIQGPGAGKDVTAAGVLADIQKIAIRLVR